METEVEVEIQNFAEGQKSRLVVGAVGIVGNIVEDFPQNFGEEETGTKSAAG